MVTATIYSLCPEGCRWPLPGVRRFAVFSAVMLRLVLCIAAFAIGAGFFAPDFVGSFVARMAAQNRPAPAAQSVDTSAGNTDYGGGQVRLSANRSGHYLADIEVNGRSLNALVDTGASMVVLRYEDARDLGVLYGSDTFEVAVQTANGKARAHRVKLDSVRLGSISLSGVDALVMEEGALNTNLLGMSFLRRLSRYEVRDGSLVLER